MEFAPAGLVKGLGQTGWYVPAQNGLEFLRLKEAFQSVLFASSAVVMHNPVASLVSWLYGPVPKYRSKWFRRLIFIWIVGRP